MQGRPNRVQAIASALLILGFFWWSRDLPAQATHATARGTVHSQAGAPVPGARIVARRLQTGQTLARSADEHGEFEFLELTPGSYEFEVSHSGFATEKKRGTSIEAGQVVTLQFALQPGSQTNSSGGASRIDESQLVGLPLNGRSYNQLATLEAGITDTGGGDASRGIRGGSLSVSGGRSASNNFLLDGTNIMDTANSVPRSAAGVQLGADAVLQVLVSGSSYAAEYGRGSGGVLNSITRSGSDEFHGNLFEYFRNSKLDSRNFFDRDPLNPLRRSDPPPFKRNQFGFTVTGPVLEGRTYFMGSFEAMRDRLTQTQVDFFPDEDARRGVITNAAGQEIRRVAVSSRVRPYLDLFPRPNSSRVGEGFARNIGSQFQPTDENYFTIRIDHKINDRDSFFGRYTFDDAASVSGQETSPFRSLTNTRQQYLTLMETHIFSLRALNSFRAGFTRPVNDIVTLSSIEIPSSLFFVPGAPVFGQIEISGAAVFGPQPQYPEANVMNTFQFSDDAVVQRGAHSLKFGAEVHRYRWDVFNSANKGATWSFSSLDNFLQGGPSGTNLTVALPGSNNQKAFRQTLAGFYVQGNYRASQRLLWNWGLRYEFATIISERDGRVVALPDIVRDTQLQIGRTLPDNPSLLNFSPRLGFSWSPFRGHNAVLSGGFGIFYDPLLEYVVDLQKSTAPFYRRVVRLNFDSSAAFPDAVAAASGLAAATPFQVEILDYRHMRSPAVLRYNLSLQQELPGGWRVQGAYVGARGNHLFRGYETNLYPAPITRADGTLFFPPNAGPVNPAFGAIRITSADAQSSYNALQLSASKSSRGGLTVQTSYTYSKSVDDASSSSSGENGAVNRTYSLMRTLDRGLSDFDVRHRLSASFLYPLPAGAGRRWGNSGFPWHILGGWRLGGILSFRTGTPFHPLSNVRQTGFLFVANRPSLRPGAGGNPTEGASAGCGPVPAGQKLGGPDRYFDPCFYTPPEPGTLGNVGRNTLTGPSAFSLDISLQKEFALHGDERLQFRAEFFNLPNHSNFANPTRGSSVVFSGFPARIGSTAGSITRTSTTARQIQFALRLSF
ncbi:MAG: TonB-dependent receptor [Acidobacteria bacterium]|nr:TonB-dependent receptor [Acidobacteriota bacterium]